MDILALAFMSSVTAATPTTPIPWFKDEDYPDEAFVRKEQGTTAFDVLVSSDGRPIDCKIVTSSGSPTLDRRACQVAMRASRFTPATAADGTPTYGVYRTQVRWALDPEQWAQMEVGPDVELSLNRLPSGAKQPVEIKYAYFVDAQGNASSCTPITLTQPKELDAMGCEQLLSKVQRTPVSVSNGSTVPAVRTGWVHFTSSN